MEITGTFAPSTGAASGRGYPITVAHTAPKGGVVTTAPGIFDTSVTGGAIGMGAQ